MSSRRFGPLVAFPKRGFVVGVSAWLVALAGLVWVSPARADAASWMFVGGGAASTEQGQRDPEQSVVLQLDAGLGTSPRNLFSFGGLFRTSTLFGQGTDLALLQRTATRGFNQGGYGLALDLGGYQRFWGGDSSGFAATLNAGAPWGLTLGLHGMAGTNDSMTFGLVLGIDWARFTAHRRSGTAWWPNFQLPLEQPPSRDPQAGVGSVSSAGSW